MTNFKMKFKLKSDATFGRGDGLASLIDSEVQHDEYGLPFLGGRSLKGLLAEECANIIFALKKQGKDGEFKIAAQHLFGNPGSSDSDKAILHVGDARLSEDIRRAVTMEIDGRYLFSWDRISGNDDEKLRTVLKQNVSIEQIKAINIEKIDGGRTIKVSIDKKSVLLRLNEDKTRVTLEIDDSKVNEFIAKTEKHKLNIYDGKKLEREDVLNSLTAIRHQTAMDEKSGAPREGSLRSMRVILRKTPFESELSFTQPPLGKDLPLLAACIKAFRRAGTGRNRGRGELDEVKLCDAAGDDITDKQFYIFQEEVMK